MHITAELTEAGEYFVHIEVDWVEKPLTTKFVVSVYGPDPDVTIVEATSDFSSYEFLVKVYQTKMMLAPECERE